MTTKEEPRTMQKITQEYGNVAARVGSRNYQIAIFQQENATDLELMRTLNQEAAKLKEDETKAEIQPTPPELKVVTPEIVQ